MEGGEGKWGCRGRMRVTGWERGGTGRGRGVGEGGRVVWVDGRRGRRVGEGGNVVVKGIPDE